MSTSRIKNLRSPAWWKDLFAGPAGKRLRTPLVILAVLGVLNALIYGLALAPATKRLSEQQDSYASMKRQHAEALLFRKQRNLLAGITADLGGQKDIPLLIKDLVQSARRLNLAVGAIKSDTPASAGQGLSMVTFTVPVTGTYTNIKRFIYDVETTSKLVGIRDLKLSSEEGLVKLDMKLVTYIQGG